jgi:hypothetical protein
MILRNGNVGFRVFFGGGTPQFTDVYAARAQARGDIRPLAQGVAIALRDCVVKRGYNTCANGWSDDLSLKKGETIRRVSAGNPSCFAVYEVLSPESDPDFSPEGLRL